MTVEEAAERLCTSVRVVLKMCKSGVLGARAPSGWDVCPTCLEEYLARPRGRGKRQPKEGCRNHDDYVKGA